MVVEPDANLDAPTTTTGGCRLTRQEVTALVEELVAFAPNYCPELEFEWDGQVDKLESPCLRIIFAPCVGQCGNCPRRMDIQSFEQDFVNQSPGGNAQLVQRDEYDPGALNIYFTGNIQLDDADQFALTRNRTPGNFGFIVVNDAAFTATNQGGNAAELTSRATVLHEALHWLSRLGHPEVPPNEWPQNLLISGATFDACRVQYNNERPKVVIPSNIETICAELEP
ncbi:MAG: hypothetical protein KDA32_10635 [Phycisphaerales bacterium]|nr:hypothetical protein [Phycisphaerales bacterium]